MLGEFLFVSGEGALPLRFGMTPADVHEHLGQAPDWSTSDSSPTTRLEEHFDDFVGVHYGKDLRVNSLVFGGALKLKLDEELPLCPDIEGTTLLALLTLDPEPFEDLGFLVFDHLGVAFTGLLPDIDEELTITIVPPGSWPAEKRGRISPQRMDSCLGKLERKEPSDEGLR